MMTEAFNQNVGKLFSELKLVTDNLFFHLCSSQLRSHWIWLQLFAIVIKYYLEYSYQLALCYIYAFSRISTEHAHRDQMGCL